jgi:hypothetical protein
MSLRSKASSFLLASVGTALSGTIALFIVMMIYLASFQLASAAVSSGGEVEAPIGRSIEADRCGAS